MIETKNCVWCLRPATSHCGHVLRGTEEILAGWCDECWRLPGAAGQLDSPEVAGEWKEAFGVQEQSDDDVIDEVAR